VKGLSPAEQKGLLLSVGARAGRRPLSPLEVGSLLKKSVDAGATPRDLAEALHLDGTSMISRFMRLLTLEASVQHEIDWGDSGSTIAFSSASELTRLKADEQRTAATAVLANAFTSGEVKQLVQLRLRSKSPLTECIDAVSKLRPTVEERHLLIGGITDDRVRSALTGMTQVYRDELFAKALSELLGSSAFSGRLGSDRFTVSGDAEVAKRLTHGAHSFEDAVTATLSNLMAQ